MKQTAGIFLLVIFFAAGCQQKQTTVKVKGVYSDGADSIAPSGIVKGLSDEQLLETVQKQTFRFFTGMQNHIWQLTRALSLL